jgi:hypothetical protein
VKPKLSDSKRLAFGLPLAQVPPMLSELHPRMQRDSERGGVV